MSDPHSDDSSVSEPHMGNRNCDWVSQPVASVTKSEPQSCNVNVSEPHTLASVDVSEPHTLASVTVNEPHSGNSSLTLVV